MVPHGGLDLLPRGPGAGVDVDPVDRQTALGGYARREVAVGREVVPIDDDLATSGPRGHRGAHQLVEEDRRGVTHRDLAGRSPETPPAEPVPQCERQVEPALVPAPDQAPAPFL